METKDIAQKLRLRPMTKSKGYTFIKYGGLISRYRFYVICSAGNSTLVKAIADNIEDKLAEAGVHPTHKEGYADARWVLLDYGDVVAHVFLEEERDFYNLEQLWADAPSEALWRIRMIDNKNSAEPKRLLLLRTIRNTVPVM